MYKPSRAALILLSLITVVVRSGQCQSQSDTSRLNGRLLDENGSPVADAKVTALRKDVLSLDSLKLSARSDSEGWFSIQDVPIGSFRLCVDAEKTQLLNPCIWSLAHELATTRGQALDLGSLTLQKGRLLTIHLSDKSLRPKKALKIGLWRENGLFVNLPTHLDSSSASAYIALVPLEKLRFLVPEGYRLLSPKDSAGQSISDKQFVDVSPDPKNIDLVLESPNER